MVEKEKTLSEALFPAGNPMTNQIKELDAACCRLHKFTKQIHAKLLDGIKDGTSDVLVRFTEKEWRKVVLEAKRLIDTGGLDDN